MCAAIAFESRTAAVTILNPLAGFAAQEQHIEVRRDPLLGDTSIAHPLLREKAGFFGVNDQEFIRRIVAESANSCIFCGPNVLEKTARYPDDLVPGGRIVVGESILLPNLFPLAAFHPLVILCRAHFLRLREFTPALLADGLTAAQRFLHAAYRADRAAVFATVNANYLFPAGASIVHPHLQMLVSPAPLLLPGAPSDGKPRVSRGTRVLLFRRPGSRGATYRSPVYRRAGRLALDCGLLADRQQRDHGDPRKRGGLRGARGGRRP